MSSVAALMAAITMNQLQSQFQKSKCEALVDGNVGEIQISLPMVQITPNEPVDDNNVTSVVFDNGLDVWTEACDLDQVLFKYGPHECVPGALISTDPYKVTIVFHKPQPLSVIAFYYDSYCSNYATYSLPNGVFDLFYAATTEDAENGKLIAVDDAWINVRTDGCGARDDAVKVWVDFQSQNCNDLMIQVVQLRGQVPSNLCPSATGKQHLINVKGSIFLTPSPTESPTKSPSNEPTRTPTRNPTRKPTRPPTKGPTANPSASPSSTPTKSPSRDPSRTPTDSPTHNPSKPPTRHPTLMPSPQPTDFPSMTPTMFPTSYCQYAIALCCPSEQMIEDCGDDCTEQLARAHKSLEHVLRVYYHYQSLVDFGAPLQLPSNEKRHSS